MPRPEPTFGSLIEWCGRKWTPVFATSVIHLTVCSPVTMIIAAGAAVAAEVGRGAARREDAELKPERRLAIIGSENRAAEIEPHVARAVGPAVFTTVVLPWPTPLMLPVP